MTDEQWTATVTEIDTGTGRIVHKAPDHDTIGHQVDESKRCLCGPKVFSYREHSAPFRTYEVVHHFALDTDHPMARWRDNR